MASGPRSKHLPRRVAVATLTVVTVLGLAAPRLMWPSLHMDESYYVGAALRILRGDVLLGAYNFDKPPLSPFLIIPGILIAGRNAVGYHLGGLICALVGIRAAQRLLQHEVATGLGKAAAALFYLALMVAPFMMFHHASAFTDPFMLMFLVLFLAAAWRSLEGETPTVRDREERLAAIYFTLASLAKLQTIMWAPALFGFWLVRHGSRRALTAGPAVFWRATRWLWAVFGVFMVTNPIKFGAILWFKHLFMKDPAHAQTAGAGVLTARAAQWLGLATASLGRPVIFWLLAGAGLTLTLALAWLPPALWARPLSWRERWQRTLAEVDAFADAEPQRARWLVLLAYPFWLHAVGIILSGAALFPRYLYPLLPQLALLLPLGLALIARRGRRWRPLAWGLAVASGAGAVALVGVAGSWARHQEFAQRETLPARAGRQLMLIRDSLPPGSVLHHQSQLWYLYPNMLENQLWPACAEAGCFAWAQVGRAPFARQYRLQQDKAGREFQVAQGFPESCAGAPFRVGASATQETEVALAPLLEEKATRGLLHLYGWAQRLSWERGAPAGEALAADDAGAACWLSWRPVPALPLTLKVEPVTALAGLLGALRFEGRLVIDQGVVAREREGAGRWVASFVVDAVRFEKFAANLVDLAPVLYGSYEVPLGPLAIADGGAPFVAIAGLTWGEGPLAVRAQVRRIAGAPL